VSGFRPRFFVPSDNVAGHRAAGSGGAGEPLPDIGDALVTLDAEDSHHALRVLRLRPGDECEVVVGAAVYAATVLPATAGGGGKPVQMRLGERLEGPQAGAYYRQPVALVQALGRPSALDLSVEKSTEAGASLILMVQTAGSPRSAGKDSKARHERWARIAREAAKQSKQPAVPLVDIEPSFAAALERLRALGLFSVVLDPLAEQTLYDLVVSRAAAGRSFTAAGGQDALAGVALWVGPESGWTEGEQEELLRAGVAGARLGRGVLRTETAGPVAVAVARLALGDW
jgi:16S rRNA (uracil1498-N3)-methyltransferase